MATPCSKQEIPGGNKNFRWAVRNCETRIFPAHEFIKCISGDSPTSRPSSHRTGKTRRFQGEFSLFLSLCFVQDPYLPAYGKWHPSKSHTAANICLTKQCKSRTSLGCSFPETPNDIRNQQFGNILDCRLHQDSSFLPLHCISFKNCSQPHTCTITSRCLYTHIKNLSFIFLNLDELYSPEFQRHQGCIGDFSGIEKSS